MRRDPAATKRRIFDAATAEFASRGVAGARIDRIAEAACANKQLIYAYFGSKQELFDAVVSEHVTRFLDEVPLDATRLPEFGVAAYDFFAAHPEIVRLGSWHALEVEESEHRIEVIERAIREHTRAVARAQAEGLIDDTIGAAELLAMVISIAQTWAIATPERRNPGGESPRLRARRRAAVFEACRRLVAAVS
ncbi:MAG: TetR family transcriptional regulator [Gaiellaceae bacterium]